MLELVAPNSELEIRSKRAAHHRTQSDAILKEMRESVTAARISISGIGSLVREVYVQRTGVESPARQSPARGRTQPAPVKEPDLTPNRIVVLQSEANSGPSAVGQGWGFDEELDLL